MSRFLAWRVLKDEFDKGPRSLEIRVGKWMLKCFGETVSADKAERNHRFLEESMELVQSLGMGQEECHQLVDYVYHRPAGDPKQEVGGVMLTLCALSLANNLDVMENAEHELARVWSMIDQIRAKQSAKPKGSPLPRNSLVIPAGAVVVMGLKPLAAH